MWKVSKSFSSKRLVAFLAAFILLDDRLSKMYVVSYVKLGESCFVAPFFNVVRVENKGITFGLFNGVTYQLIWVLLSLMTVISLCVWAQKNKRYWMAITMIVSGAIGNIIDRLIYGGVVDFLDFHVSKYHWPAFNVADSVIVIGVCLLMFISYREEEKS
jgi:signal peptidase II